MTATIEQTDTLGALDFEPQVICCCDGMDGECGNVAHLLLSDESCHACGEDCNPYWPCARECWDEMGVWGTYCAQCGTDFPRDEHLRIVEVLR